jgi:hypothetical protein
MATVIVKEGDGHTARVTWKDGDGNAVTPTTSRYRVDCLTSGNSPLIWQSLSSASTITIAIPGTANVIQSSANETETKQITVQADYGTINQKTVVAEYVVQNNDFVS